VFTILDQSDSSLTIHPIGISKEKMYFFIVFHASKDILDTTLWLQGPLKESIKSSLTAILNLDNMLKVCFPSSLFIFLKFESIVENSFYELISKKKSVHHSGWANV
jgi:hypothetical protein